MLRGASFAREFHSLVRVDALSELVDVACSSDSNFDTDVCGWFLFRLGFPRVDVCGCGVQLAGALLGRAVAVCG